MYSRNSGAFTVLDDLVIAYRLIHVFLELCVKTLHMNMTSTARAEMDSMGDSEDGARSFDDQQAVWTRLLIVRRSCISRCSHIAQS
jgi:hypothetical protein